MKKWIANILGIIVIVFVINSCKKNDGAGRLYLKLRPMNNFTYKDGESIKFEFDFSHPTSEEQTDTLFIRREFYNCTNRVDMPTPFIIPTFVSTADLLGEITLNYNLIGDNKGLCTNSLGNKVEDSVHYFFCLKDKKGNRTDTIKSPKLYLKP